MAEIVKARIDNGIVAEAFLLDDALVPEHLSSWVTAPVEVGDGWQYDGTTFTPPTAEYMWNKLFSTRQNMKLSFAQLLIGLVTEAWITEAEGDAWADGTLPAAVLTLIASLPASEQFAARTRAKRPSEIIRTDPLVIALGAAQGKTVEEIDTFFVTYAQV